MCRWCGVMSPALVRGGKRITHMNEQEEVAEAVSNLLTVSAPDMTELASIWWLRRLRRALTCQERVGC